MLYSARSVWAEDTPRQKLLYYLRPIGKRVVVCCTNRIVIIVCDGGVGVGGICMMYVYVRLGATRVSDESVSMLGTIRGFRSRSTSSQISITFTHT